MSVQSVVEQTGEWKTHNRQSKDVEELLCLVIVKKQCFLGSTP